MASVEATAMTTPMIVPPNRVDGYMKSTTGNYRLYCKYWKPTTPLRSVVFLAHGFAEYSDYYERLAQQLFAQSIYVFTHDHVGHGRSEGVRGYISSVDDYCNDVFAHFKKIEEDESLPVLPYFIAGMSMGGTIALKMAIKKPDMFRGLVLIAPAMVLKPELASVCVVFVARFVSRLLPYFPVAPINYDTVSRNKRKVERMSNDALCLHGRVKARWTGAMMNAFEEIKLNMSNMEFPYLLLQGTHDVIVGKDGAKMFQAKSASKDKTLKMYPGAYHSLHQELDYVTKSVLKEIVEWICDRVSNDVDYVTCITEVVTLPEDLEEVKLKLMKISEEGSVEASVEATPSGHHSEVEEAREESLKNSNDAHNA